MKQQFLTLFQQLRQGQIKNFLIRTKDQTLSANEHIQNAVVFPGSFDPIHDGHVEMIRIASEKHPK